MQNRNPSLSMIQNEVLLILNQRRSNKPILLVENSLFVKPTLVDDFELEIINLKRNQYNTFY